MRMNVKHPITNHYNTKSTVQQFNDMFEDMILSILNQCGVYKIESMDFKFKQSYRDRFEDDLVFDITVSRTIVNPMINYNTIVDCINRQGMDIERIMIHGY